MSNYQISFLENNHIQEAAKVLSIAMLHNPIHVATFQGNGDHERMKIEQMFIGLFTKLPGIVFLAKKGRKIVGVMRMKSCVGSNMLANSMEGKEKNSLEYRRYIWQKEWASHDPVRQHWHLGPIGVLPGYRRMGIGSELMHIFCEQVDACSAQAYLETDLDENVRFYQKFGFEVIATSTIFQVENRYMLRKPKT